MASGQHRILVVDDDPGVRELIADALRLDASNYEVETAVDGVDAGLKLEAFRPDLIVLDVIMPGMGGLEVCNRIRHQSDLDDTKIIILTGAPDSGKAETSLVYGADLFLQKPQPIDVLLAHIEELLEGN
ncbi:MAG: response regulator [Acidobacteria bacterium]|nr:response regulator [Acidobacteriota bacterium]NIM63185.1 response regulator [Acidobacteriota bacterium]NIO59573.1 response regulator [Acidobacteriota bacterium]NIQ30587.1 response regulator [Acidobacteriota bacterium]NIQ85553.1 response regulator [Acidobacteriota bacterium]